MELIADRFLVLCRGVLDLATGGPVMFKQLPAASPDEESRWAASAGRDAGRHGDSSARLLDFGLTAQGCRFEAWSASVESTRTIRGTPNANRAIAPLADAIENASGARPRVVAIFGDDAVFASTVAEAARHARRHGFIPVATRLLGTAVRAEGERLVQIGDLLEGRSLFLIHDDFSPGAALVHAVLVSPRPHILVCAARARLRGIDTISVEREPLPPTEKQTKLPRAAEQAAKYATRPEHDGLDSSSVTLPASGAAGTDLLPWRRRVVEAQNRLEAGRCAGGERLLRHAVGGLIRRADWPTAGEALNSLARALLRRGCPQSALVELGRAREVLAKVQDEGGLIDSAILAGRARLQLAKLDEAETTLSAAVSASTAAGDQHRAVRATAALANVLLWRGRYAEARELADNVDEPGGHAAVDTVRVIASIGAGRLRDAVTAAANVADRIRDAGRSIAIARASVLSAFARLAVGDLDSVVRDMPVATRAAAAAGDRLLVIRCRLLSAEAARRLNRREQAAALVARLTRVGDKTLPPLIRAHVRLLSDLLGGSEPADVIAGRIAKSTGLLALQLLVPSSNAEAPGTTVSAQDVVDILELCHTAEDETDVLRQVCARAVERLHAAAAGIYVVGTGGPALVVSEGSGLDADVAARAIDAGISIDPHQRAERIDAAAPVRYGGAPIGAIAARWALGTPYLRGRASGFMTTIATALAPCLAALRARRALPPTPDLIGVSAGTRELRAAIDRAAPAPFAVLIEGESGSGKELVARALHRRSLRRDRPFCTLNCAALPEDLVESELFGHARGSFTGAIGDRTGVFEESNGGTLFLDEVSELSPRAQAKLLRVVQEGELRRVGENVARRVDVRLVAASNRNLRRESDEGRFRTDLLYRLDVVHIAVPPLRERREDIPLLVEHYWRQATARIGSRAVLSAATMAALARYDWPGNVRELQNVLASLAVRAGRRGVVGPSALPPLFGAGPAHTSCRLDEARRDFEERFVRAALVRAGGRRVSAAAELGLTRQGLTKLMARLGIP